MNDSRLGWRREGVRVWASRWFTGMKGLLCRMLRVFAAVVPTRSPPARPGPAVAAKAEICSRESWAWESVSLMREGRTSRWARAAISGTTPPKG